MQYGPCFHSARDTALSSGIISCVRRTPILSPAMRRRCVMAVVCGSPSTMARDDEIHIAAGLFLDFLIMYLTLRTRGWLSEQELDNQGPSQSCRSKERPMGHARLSD